MKINFTKMHGAGNDYVYIDCTKYNIKCPEEVAIKLSDRHFGIGSDGVIFIRKSADDLFMMDLYNADGSRAKMCGNGIRCVAKFLYDKGLEKKAEFDIDTLSGIKHVKLNTENGKCVSVRVSMGIPKVGFDAPIEKGLDLYKGRCINVGNPHIVIVTDPDNCETLGKYIEASNIFEGGINSEFVRIDDDENVTMRVWERGSGETLCCGTGCTAVFAALKSQGFLPYDYANIHCLGGTIKIEWRGEGFEAFMTGPCETVFEGEIDI